MNVMLLAAGEGTRLRPHTYLLPKPSMPFLNMPLAAYSLAFASNVGIDKLVVNTYHLPEKIVHTFESLYKGPLHFSHETGELLGSGGGLKKAQHFLNDQENFLLMNADEVILAEDENILRKACERHQANNALATLLVMDFPGVGTKFGGVWCRKNKVLGFGKDPVVESEKAWHFIGVQILNQRIFDYLPAQGASNILYDGLVSAIARGEKVEVFPIQCRWFETGNEVDFIHATQEALTHWKNGDYAGKRINEAQKLFAAMPSTLRPYSNGTLLQSRTAVIDSNVEIEGFVTLAEGSHAHGPNHLKNVCVGPQVHAQPQQNPVNKIILS